MVSKKETYGKLKLNLQIFVSKNDGPFALKEVDGKDEYRDSAQLSISVKLSIKKMKTWQAVKIGLKLWLIALIVYFLLSLF